MKIVQYNHTYAQKVAEMWNKSSSNWGNDEIFKTEEDIINSESSSGNIKLYLALDNDQVVGYCSFSEYQHDEGASYLPLLNVIPEYHGKKVGKQLILKVLQDAIESKWSRFDLYTWSGNIKAMPLYKKCGFFWERKNDSVHLMNFLPYIKQTKALEDYMAKIDTYSDNKRFIDMEQDGITRNGFDYYRYEFKNSDIALNLEFEKTGRGLTSIDSPDYSIAMKVHSHELVYNNSYEVTFDIMNKTNQPLDIKIMGKDNKNIAFSLEENVKVDTAYTVTGQYTVGPIIKDQDPSRTHPVIEADIYIDGKKATFKTGVEPKHPVKVKLFIDKYNHLIGKEYNAYLDIENNLSNVEEFRIELPSNDFVTFEDNVSIVLKPKDKRSIQVKYILKDYGFYHDEVTVNYQTFTFKSIVYSPFKGSTKSFIGKTDYLYYMISGNYVVYVNMKSGNIALKKEYGSDANTAFMVPKLGKPYSLEFSTQTPEIEVINDNELTATYTSNAFDGIKLIRHIKHIFGVLETSYEIVNTKDNQEISLHVPVWQTSMDTLIPYAGKLLFLNLDDEADIGNFESELVDENWMYNKKERYGFAWEQGLQMKVQDWRLGFDIEDIALKKNESYRTPNFYASLVHKTVKDFRDFRGYIEERDEMSYQEIIVNSGNPFTKGNSDIYLKNHKKAPLVGHLSIDETHVKIDETINTTPGLKTINVLQKDKDTMYKRMLFLSQGSISKTVVEDSHIIENGLLTFKASKEYADSIYSLIFNNNEYLDSNYPTPKERSWWGDFVGGITQRINGIQDISALKEKREINFTSLKDNFGNEWEGIKVSLLIEKDPNLKGIQIDTYTVTLPNTPVVCSFANITNKSGKFMASKQFHKFNVLRISEDKGSVQFKKSNITYKCNDIGLEIDMKHFVHLTSSEEYHLSVYNPKCMLEMDTQKNHNILFSHTKETLIDNESKQLGKDFFIFSKETMKEEYIKDLKNIKFEV